MVLVSVNTPLIEIVLQFHFFIILLITLLKFDSGQFWPVIELDLWTEHF